MVYPVPFNLREVVLDNMINTDERRLKIKNMRLNFRKISAIGASVLLTGMTLGVAAAANYPAPFVQGGAANVAIVYGSSAMPSDALQAGNIQTDLQSYMGASSGSSSSVSTSGETVSLGSGSTKIWLNTSINTATATLTKSDLPSILGEYTFSGNVDSKLTSTISVGSDKITFAKQPTSNSDPVIGITMGTANSDPLYNVSVTMPAIAFNNTNSEGETIKLFGKEYVVSTATDATSLVLFSSAQKATLTLGGSSPTPSATVTIDGADHTVTLVSGDSSSALVSVDGGASTSISSGSSKKVGGIDIAVTNIVAGTDSIGTTATLLIGSEKMTLTDATQVLIGSSDDPIDGTYVTFTGTVDALTGINIAVYAPEVSNDAILEGESFVDPVFGTFKVDFSGLSVPMDSSTREEIRIDGSGDKGMSLTMTDSSGNAKTFDFIYNSTTTFLGDSNGYRINLLEGATLYQSNYTVIGNEDYGHLLQLTRIYNSSTSDYSKDAVEFKGIIDGEPYKMDATAEGTGRLTVDGRQYTVTYSGSGETGTATLKYPTSDTSSTQYVVFPTIETQNGALVGLYEPQTLTLSGTSIGFSLPDGDGYTTVTLTPSGDNNVTFEDWSVSGAGTSVANINTSSGEVAGNTGTTLTVGQLTYHLNSTSTVNSTTLKLLNPSNGAEISTPAVVIFEGKGDTSTNDYEAIVVDVEANAAGTSSDPLGVSDVYFSSSNLWDSVSLQSDSDISQSVDYYGTLVSEDSNTASQKTVSISYPKEQVYGNVYVGGIDSSVSSGSSSNGAATSLGQVFVKDSEVSSIVSTKNLIVVGGSCVNSAAATLVGGAYCGADWTTATGVGQGQFLIKGYQDSSLAAGKLALLVAGYEIADTVNAATYLVNQKPDTAKAWKGSSDTFAEQIVEAQ